VQFWRNLAQWQSFMGYRSGTKLLYHHAEYVVMLWVCAPSGWRKSLVFLLLFLPAQLYARMVYALISVIHGRFWGFRPSWPNYTSNAMMVRRFKKLRTLSVAVPSLVHGSRTSRRKSLMFFSLFCVRHTFEQSENRPFSNAISSLIYNAGWPANDHGFLP